ncbi:hypothetical protein D3C76_1613130 [compost metagenome]
MMSLCWYVGADARRGATLQPAGRQLTATTAPSGTAAGMVIPVLPAVGENSVPERFTPTVVAWVLSTRAAGRPAGVLPV